MRRRTTTDQDALLDLTTWARDLDQERRRVSAANAECAAGCG